MHSHTLSINSFPLHIPPHLLNNSHTFPNKLSKSISHHIAHHQPRAPHYAERSRTGRPSFSYQRRRNTYQQRCPGDHTAKRCCRWGRWGSAATHGPSGWFPDTVRTVLREDRTQTAVEGTVEDRDADSRENDSAATYDWSNGSYTDFLWMKYK